MPNDKAKGPALRRAPGLSVRTFLGEVLPKVICGSILRRLPTVGAKNACVGTKLTSERKDALALFVVALKLSERL
jgi:hypothetical protein